MLSLTLSSNAAPRTPDQQHARAGGPHPGAGAGAGQLTGPTVAPACSGRCCLGRVHGIHARHAAARCLDCSAATLPRQSAYSHSSGGGQAAGTAAAARRQERPLLQCKLVCWGESPSAAGVMQAAQHRQAGRDARESLGGRGHWPSSTACSDCTLCAMLAMPAAARSKPIVKRGAVRAGWPLYCCPAKKHRSHCWDHFWVRCRSHRVPQRQPRPLKTHSKTKGSSLLWRAPGGGDGAPEADRQDRRDQALPPRRSAGRALAAAAGAGLAPPPPGVFDDAAK